MQTLDLFGVHARVLTHFLQDRRAAELPQFKRHLTNEKGSASLSQNLARYHDSAPGPSPLTHNIVGYPAAIEIAQQLAQAPAVDIHSRCYGYGHPTGPSVAPFDLACCVGPADG